jgi:hypothetical protein
LGGDTASQGCAADRCVEGRWSQGTAHTGEHLLGFECL